MTVTSLMPVPPRATPAGNITPFAATMPLEARALIGELAEALLDAGHAALALLDELDGDPDLEAEPDDEEDDPSGQCDEDGINTALAYAGLWSGPGCPLSDPTEGLGQEWRP